MSRSAQLCFSLLVIVVLAGCRQAEPTHLSMEVISSQPHLVTGGNALIEVVASVSAAQSLILSVNGAVVPTMFMETGSIGPAFSPELYGYRTLLQGLNEGSNIVQISEGSHSAQLTLVNYPITGPVISGPHQQPYFCLNQLTPSSSGNKRRFAIGNGEFLDDTPLDEFCSLPTRTDYVYRSADTEKNFQPLADMSARPADLATTINSEGIELPFIVRIETGTINRAIYQIAVLHDPLLPASALAGWNERLLYNFGGGCEPGYFQGAATAGVLRESALGLGYAIASSSLNVNAQGGCNDVISAETAMMVKEHFIENYGEPRYTIGNGASGGAMQQLLIAGAYPGILDGIIPSMTFSDAVTYMTDSQECSLLLRNFVNDPTRQLSDEVKASIGGWPNWYLCNESLGSRPDRVAPHGCSAEIPVAARYDALTNPDGVRCSIYDGMKNIFGEKYFAEINSQRAFAINPHDNVGVQYGLQALNAGLIDTTLFLDLNEQIGGWDIDFNPIPERMEGDDEAIRIAYETGRVTNGLAGLSRVPVIDDRPYLDHEGNFHASVYSFTTRARLERDNGHADNYVIRRHSASLSLADENLALMDQWLAAIRADLSNTDMLRKIVQARPESLQDDCFTESGERIVESAVYDTAALFSNRQGQCNTLYPPHAGLRLVAGGPLSNDVLKCELKPVDPADYQVEFTAEEKSRLAYIFPMGVCDWEKPGQHQSSNQIWLSFGPSPVNQDQNGTR
jgi:hypothetical protein